jgi:cellulose synthase/poly-beta-1,6-N-acetylglucosamine synthase-like glycosyltransferase
MLGDMLSVLLALGLGFLTLFTVAQAVFLLAAVFLRGRLARPAMTFDRLNWPQVAVQLPLYNERFVAVRLMQAAAALDYPRDRLTVQVLDDSTDDTAQLVAEQVRLLRRGGLNIQHVRRPTRTGYKAGALQHGLTLLADVPFVAIFDADFVPEPDFLRRMLPHLLRDSRVGFVQARWGHLNATENWLTRAQALGIDAHFWIEQAARQALGLLLTFNGSGGIWRTACIHEAGGWQHDTLTEDFDLSYRAQLKGWRGALAVDVVVPAEVPPGIEAYKAQQARWASGSDQTLFKLGTPLLRARVSPLHKLFGLLHMLQFLPPVTMLALLLLAPALIVTQAYADLPMGIISVLAVVPPLMHLITQRALHPRDWLLRCAAYPALMLLGLGMQWNNSAAFVRAVRSWRAGTPLEFRRTPKQAGQDTPYALRPTDQNAVELALALYAGLTALLAWHYAPSLVLWFALNAAGLLTTATWGWLEARRVTLPQRQAQGL